MKKSKRQWLFIGPTLMALLIALSLGTVGCGDDDDDDDDVGVSASAARGGLVYDKSWEVAASSVTSSAVDPSGNHPLWATQSTNTRSGSDTWRCKECHGWDYKGADGAYGTGSSHFTGFPGVLEFASAATREDLIGALSGDIADHDFGPNGLNQLDDTDIGNLADFMIEGLIDMDDFIDPATKASNGNASHGETLYAGQAGCLACHGERGTKLLFDDGAESVGSLANDNPWEILHKIRWGQPGSSPAMPAGIRDNGLSDADTNDILAYVQSLPVTWACGDGFVDGDEGCDDGNTTSGDGCAADCTAEAGAGVCGDGTVDPGEECDDGNTTAGDGCAADCTSEGGGGGNVANGETLWTTAQGTCSASCAVCHSSGKAGRTAAQITAAIDGNVGGMSCADSLTDQDLADLEAFMATQ